MVFGMLDGVFFKLGPIPVDHIIFTEWVIIGLIGLIAFLQPGHADGSSGTTKCL